MDELHGYGRLPVLGICGRRGSGKTTLLEALIPRLCERGLSVAVLKRAGCALDVDRPGKDSDRLFRAGATVAVSGPTELFGRRAAERAGIRRILDELLSNHDLVFVEGHHRSISLRKLWLCTPGETAPPPELPDVVATLPWEGDRLEAASRILDQWLSRAWASIPIVGGVLVGGGSRRMGARKQLLVHDGAAWTERIVAALGRRASPVVALGSGELPPALAGLPRLADPPGLEGPIAGIVGALRWCPDHAWIVAACDHPFVSAEAVDWLLAQRAPGIWGVMPRQPDGVVNPLFGVYEPQARSLLDHPEGEALAGPGAVAAHPRVATPEPPPALAQAWVNVNTPEDLRRLGLTNAAAPADGSDPA